MKNPINPIPKQYNNYNSEANYYEVLGVKNYATFDQIRRAYKRSAHKIHPDKNDHPEAKENFQRLNQAYETLSDPVKRAQYDKCLELGINNIPDIEKEAISGLHQLIMFIIDNYDDDVIHLDLFDTMDSIILSEIKKCDIKSKLLHKSIKKLEKAQKRIKANKGKNIFDIAFKKKIIGLKRDQFKVENTSNAFTRMKEIIENYEYDFDEKPENSWGTPTNTITYCRP